MDTNHPSGSNANPGRPERAAAPSGQPANSARRRLFRGAAAGTGVLLAVQAKSALGQAVCQSPSAMISGNLSRPPNADGTCSGGRSPGFWKVPQHFPNWTGTGVEPAELPEGTKTCLTGMGNLRIDDPIHHGTPLNDLFPGAVASTATVGTLGGTGLPEPPGVWTVMAFPKDPVFGDMGILLFHLSAAYLNAMRFNSPTPTFGEQYPINAAQVQDMWIQLKTTGVYCPSSIPQCTAPWNAEQVKAYIESLYDINSDEVVDLCKPHGNN